MAHLKLVLSNVHTDCITKCEGAKKIYNLKVYRITQLFRKEVKDTDEGSQVATMAKLSAEHISLEEFSPVRALEARVLILIIEFGRTDYVCS
jgi:hypothetical protein